ncbi:DNA polymerase III subunit epsilon [Rhodoplanes sp. TEM]|uniref:DNA polymerase III subunit epsilon n=1 Tax=Rhodoplanes tepidamans TaxID=200616 RepID=A0ABT5J3N3_RHOTP|nr:MULTISPECIES: DNA polymerase III subunit epsilon [Rhodoplanes]MDC7784238.1 DNA polymerase III subunit epsilon [Rhodoplanes tepidamans]MDC7983630.1 DNA polymerase III subunit epsilon [Rhodoplanes sp. TEM]MDQ0353637.1 DNA polymerase-3 subunit epsilon [Rhodoplanes tepidamans]
MTTREIVFDTETTGLDPYKGDRLVEIGCIELLNRVPSGQTFHKYLNPQRDMPAEAFAVHGLSAEFLADKPLFADVVEEFVAFLGDAPLIAHNASFDLGFINAELERCGLAPIPRTRLVDTLQLARRKYPGASNRLDDLCARYRIDTSRRVKHGALLDAELLAEVYLELIEARQVSLDLVSVETVSIEVSETVRLVRARPAPLPPRLDAADIAAHRAFVGTLGDQAIWKDYLPAPEPAAEETRAAG